MNHLPMSWKLRPGAGIQGREDVEYGQQHENAYNIISWVIDSKHFRIFAILLKFWTII